MTSLLSNNKEGQFSNLLSRAGGKTCLTEVLCSLQQQKGSAENRAEFMETALSGNKRVKGK